MEKWAGHTDSETEATQCVVFKSNGRGGLVIHNYIVWGLRLWQPEQAPVWEFSWYWLELSAPKVAIFAIANIKFQDESF